MEDSTLKTASTLLALFLLITVTCTASPRYEVVNLGTLPGDYASQTIAINDNGQIVGTSNFYHNDSIGYDEISAFLWEKGAMVKLPPLNNCPENYPAAINNAGQIIVNTGCGPAIWEQGKIKLLPIPQDTARETVTTLVDIDDSGQILYEETNYSFSQNDLTGSMAIHILYKGMDRKIVSYPNTFANAVALNNSGQVLINYRPGDSVDANYIWKNNQKTILPGNGYCYDMNNMGIVVGTLRNGNIYHATRWNPDGSLTDLDPTGISSAAYAINDKWQIVGSCSSNDNKTSACLWENGNSYKLNDLVFPTGWNIANAKDINNNGQIIGSASYNGKGYGGEILLSPIPTSTNLGEFIVTRVINPAPYTSQSAFFFAQRVNLPFATKVNNWNSSYTPKVGDKISISGRLTSSHNIYDAVVTRISQSNALPKPLGVNQQTLQDAIHSKGLSLSYLRVKIWGKPQKPASSTDIEDCNGYKAAYINDGSNISWPNPLPHQKGLKLMTRSLTTLDAVNNANYYSAEGIVDIDIASDYNNRPMVWLNN